MSGGSDASFDKDMIDDADHDDDAAFGDDDDDDENTGNTDNDEDDDDAAYVDDDANESATQEQQQQQHEEEIIESIKKIEKIVNNLIARADSVPFREPGEFSCTHWNLLKCFTWYPQ